MTGAFLFSCKKNDTGVLFYGTPVSFVPYSQPLCRCSSAGRLCLTVDGFDFLLSLIHISEPTRPY